MKSLFLLTTLATTSLVALPLGAQAPAAQKKDDREVVNVDPATKLIESKSLHPDGSVAMRIQAGARGRHLNEGQTGTGSDPWAINTGMPALTADSNLNGNKEELPNAETYYKFVLLPQEKLKLNLDCEKQGMITMMFITPPHPETEMAAQFKKANQTPKAARTRNAEIQNVTNRPYVIYLLMQGTANYAFKLGIERSGGLVPPEAAPKS